MRKLVLLLALVLVISACGGVSGDSGQTTAAPGSTSATQETAAPTDTAESADPPASDVTTGADAPDEPAEQAPSFDGPPAPDFELALADGSNFSLSAEQKPVYVVFWAEW